MYELISIILHILKSLIAFCLFILLVADIVWRNSQFSGMKISALVLIEVGLLLTILPEGWHHHVIRGFRFVKELVTKPPPEEDIAPQTSRFEWRNSIN